MVANRVFTDVGQTSWEKRRSRTCITDTRKPDYSLVVFNLKSRRLAC